MAQVLRYTRSDELEPVAITWYEPDGTLYDFSSGWTFRARIGTGSGFLVEKTTGFAGAATTPNLSINFTAGELDGVGSGTYHLDVQATLTATTQTITRTWMFQVLAGVGTDTLPQNPTGLGVLGDLSVDGDFMMPTVGIEADGDVTSGVIRRTHSIQIPWNYTHNSTGVPTDTAFGTAVLVDGEVTLTGNGQGFGPEFATSFFGPRCTFQFETTVRYGANQNILGCPNGYGDFLTHANVAGQNRTMTSAWAFLAARSTMADGATVTMRANDYHSGGAAFVDSAIWGTVDSGTLDGISQNYDAISFLTKVGFVGNTSVKRRIAYVAGASYYGIHPIINNPVGEPHWSGIGDYDATSTSTVQVDEEIGLLVEPFTVGDVKVGIDSAHMIRLLTANITNTTTSAVSGIQIGQGKTFTLNDTGGGFRTGNNFVGYEANPTVVYDADGGVLGNFAAYQSSPVLKNAATEAHTLPLTQMVSLLPTFRGDGAALTVTSYIGLSDNPNLDIINAGSVAATGITSFESKAAIGASVTVTTRKSVNILDASGSGTLTTQVGVDIAALAKGGTNIGIRNASTEVATPSVQTLTAVGNTITPNAKVKRLDNTSGGSLTLTSNPHISDGQDGQILVLFNSSANDVVLTDGNGVQLGAATRTLGTRDSLMLLYSTTIGDWIELAFNGAN